MKSILNYLGVIIFLMLQPVSAAEQNGWVVNGKILHPACFVTEWMSSDNFEEFEDRFGIINSDHFRRNPGEYFGREITDYRPLEASWDRRETVALIQALDSCSSTKFENKAVDGGVHIVTSFDSYDLQQRYKILNPVSLDQCSSMAPDIGSACIESYRMEVGEYSGGSMGWDIRKGTYGLFNLPSIGMVIVPLRYR